MVCVSPTATTVGGLGALASVSGWRVNGRAAISFTKASLPAWVTMVSPSAIAARRPVE